MSGDARLRTVRMLGRVLAVGLLALVTAPPAPAGAADSRGAATQDGWWNRLQGPGEAEPEANPVRPLIPALPSPPTVPADAIAAGVTAGQVDKVAAVGIDVALADGTRLEGLVLRLKESTADGANVGAAAAKVVACPATAAWGPIQNGAWRDRPAADCALGSAEGSRGDDGTWTFDLAAIGRLWADPTAPLGRNGVVLSVDPAGSPATAQVSWLNFASGNVAVDLVAQPAVPSEAAGSSPPGPPAPVAAAAPTPPAPAAPAPVAARQTFSTAGGGFVTGPFDSSAGTPVTAARPSEPSLPPTPPDSTPSAAPDTPGAVQPARPAVGFWEALPASTALLVPVAAGLAVLVGLALGPAGRPTAVHRREGGLTRAVARRAGAGAAASGPPGAAR